MTKAKPSRRWRVSLIVALAVLTMTLAGCAALRNEWSDKHGGPDIDGRVRAAVQDALPASAEVSVSSHKNGFSQEMDVDVTLADSSFDADDLVAITRAVCEAVEATDVVFLRVADGSLGSRLDLEALVTAQFPDLDTPYDPTQVQLQVEEDCAGI